MGVHSPSHLILMALAYKRMHFIYSELVIKEEGGQRYRIPPGSATVNHILQHEPDLWTLYGTSVHTHFMYIYVYSGVCFHYHGAWLWK